MRNARGKSSRAPRARKAATSGARSPSEEGCPHHLVGPDEGGRGRGLEGNHAGCAQDAEAAWPPQRQATATATTEQTLRPRRRDAPKPSPSSISSSPPTVTSSPALFFFLRALLPFFGSHLPSPKVVLFLFFLSGVNFVPFRTSPRR